MVRYEVGMFNQREEAFEKLVRGFPGLRDEDYLGDFPLRGKVTAG
jgi:hypothetical protein